MSAFHHSYHPSLSETTPVRHRRDFLTQTAIAATATALSPSVQAQEAPLPAVPFGRTTVTKLICGSNPMYGYSHFNPIFDRHMKEFSTHDQNVKLMHYCEKMGINTIQTSFNEFVPRDIRRYRDEGGAMQWISLCRNVEQLNQAIGLKPIAVSYHGWFVNQHRLKKEYDKIHDMVKAIKDKGAMGGFSCFDPELLKRAENEQWETDFYITPMYNIFRSQEETEALLGEKPYNEVYLPSDLDKMCRVVRTVNKPCLGIKVLAAGRLVNNRETKVAAIQRTLSGMKQSDAVIIGMYQKFSDQVQETVELVREAL